MDTESLDINIYQIIYKHARLSKEKEELKDAIIKVTSQINAVIELINKEFQTFQANINIIQSNLDTVKQKSNKMDSDLNAAINQLNITVQNIQQFIVADSEISDEITRVQKIFENIDKNALQNIIEVFTDYAFLYVRKNAEVKVETLPYTSNTN